MIAIWMAYALVTGLIVALTCLLTERVARIAHLGTRGIWLGGMLVMLLLAAGAAVPRSFASPAEGTAEVSAQKGIGERTIAQEDREWQSGAVSWLREWLERPFVTLQARLASASERLSRWDYPLLALWALLSAFLAGVAVHAALEARRLRHTLEPREVGGTTVLMTHGLGPSAAGIRSPAILLPNWALELDEALLALVLRHEREHVQARDPALLLLGLLAVVLVPWHLPLWWSWRRLRLAIEVDCDSRVLRAHPGERRYAELLLLTAQRAPDSHWASRAVFTMVAPLRPRASSLAERILVMTSSRTSRSLLRVPLAGLGALVLAALALALPTPRQAQAAAAQERAVIVHLTEVGLIDTIADSLSILVYTTGGAQVGIGADPPAALSDTLRLNRLPAITADVTDGEVHIELRGPGAIKVGGKVTGGRATRVSATGRHIVLLKGGVGIYSN